MGIILALWGFHRRCRLNSGFAKKRVQWLIEHSTSHQILCYIDSFELRNPLLRKAANRYRQVYDDSANMKHTTKNWTLTQGQTILTVEQHTDHISNGQRVSRHSLPTLCFLFFFHPHFLKTNKRSDSRAPLKDNLNKRVILTSPQVAHLALPHPQADPSQSQKSHFLPTHRLINVIKKVTLTDIDFRWLKNNK